MSPSAVALPQPQRTTKPAQGCSDQLEFCLSSVASDTTKTITTTITTLRTASALCPSSSKASVQCVSTRSQRSREGRSQSVGDIRGGRETRSQYQSQYQQFEVVAAQGAASRQSEEAARAKREDKIRDIKIKTKNKPKTKSISKSKAKSISRSKFKSKSKSFQRQEFLLKLCGHDSRWINSALTAEDISLLKLDLDLSVAPTPIYTEPALGLSSLDPSSSDPTPPLQSTPAMEVLDLDDSFNKVCYVSRQIAARLPAGASDFSNTESSYPSWALGGISHAAWDEDYPVMITCHTGQPGANKVLRSELLACLIAADELVERRGFHDKNDILEGRIISVTLDSLRILDFHLDSYWLGLMGETSRMQITLKGVPFDTDMAWEEQDLGLSASVLDTLLAR